MVSSGSVETLVEVPVSEMRGEADEGSWVIFKILKLIIEH